MTPGNKARTARDPLARFTRWYAKAERSGLEQPNAMTLATADAGGRPSGRIVLLKSFDVSGFVFYTNYLSRKGRELAENPVASLVFWWEPLYRQVRIDGRVVKATAMESDAYFSSRPRGYRLGAWASDQSTVIESRMDIIKRYFTLRKQYRRQPVPRPEHWGGYRLVPDHFEFWQGRANRLHDRYDYILGEDGEWKMKRLAP